MSRTIAEIFLGGEGAYPLNKWGYSFSEYVRGLPDLSSSDNVCVAVLSTAFGAGMYEIEAQEMQVQNASAGFLNAGITPKS